MRFLRLVVCLVAMISVAAAAPRTLADFAKKAERREPLSVVFFGGSLTYGANASDPNTTSYRGLMMRWLREKYPNTPITFHDAAIGGTGSQLGLFRLERDVLKHHPDLVFLDFTVNDGAEDTDVQALASYERIVRGVLESNSALLPVLTLFKWHADSFDEPRPPRHEAHLQLAKAYALPVANVLDDLRAKVKGGVRTADLWNLGDGAHPGDEGYQLFFESVRNAFEQGAASAMPVIIPAKPVFEDRYPKQRRALLTEKLADGWSRRKTYRTALWFDGLSSRWMSDVAVVSKVRPAVLEIDFNGSMVGIFGERDGLTPPIRVWIDGKTVQQPKSAPKDFVWKLDTSRFAPPKKGSGNLFLWQVLANDLADGPHQLRIEPVWEGTDKDAELRIESVCSAGR